MNHLSKCVGISMFIAMSWSFADTSAPQEKPALSQKANTTEWKPAETAKERRKQLQQVQEELYKSKETSAALFALAEGDEALLAANRRLDEYAASIAEDARMTDGRAGLPAGFYETRNALIAEEQKALKAAMGETNYKTYTSELTKQQILLRRVYILRQLERKEAQ